MQTHTHTHTQTSRYGYKPFPGLAGSHVPSLQHRPHTRPRCGEAALLRARVARLCCAYADLSLCVCLARLGHPPLHRPCASSLAMGERERERLSVAIGDGHLLEAPGVSQPPSHSVLSGPFASIACTHQYDAEVWRRMNMRSQRDVSHSQMSSAARFLFG